MSVQLKVYMNNTNPSETNTLQSPRQDIYSRIESFFANIDRLGHKYILAPFRWFLSQLDPLSYKLEGTRLKKVLQVVIYPLFLWLTFVIGFRLVENGFTLKTFFQSILMFLVLGAIFAPLEHLMPFSRKWLNDKEASTDIMLFFGNKYWGDFINAPIRLATIAVVVKQISPTIGQDIWPVSLHPWIQVLLLLSINDFFRYWYHRWMHENEFMWQWHAVHHSSERLYWFNGTRSHPLEGLVQSLLWAIPLAFVKAPVEVAVVTNLLGRVIGRFQHTNMDIKAGIFDYIFSTPKNHRYHHSKIAKIGHTNYGGDVIFWDLLFGTFYLPKGEEPSDEIGIEEMPNYPKTWFGLMMAPFIYKKLKREANQISGEKH